MKGTYLLVLQLKNPVEQLRIGRLGSFDFAPGYYLYIGSAFGPGGLAARLARHQAQIKARPHWHIDYLRSHAELLEMWVVGHSTKLEQSWCTSLLQAPELQVPIPGFGASDTPCMSHLFYTPKYPHVRLLSHWLFQIFPLEIPLKEEVIIEILSGSAIKPT